MQYKDSVKELYGGVEDTTISRMELYATIVALEAIKTKTIPVDIHCDSAYVVNCFEERWYLYWERNERWKNSKGKPVENRDLWERLLSLWRNQKECNFIKVAGHSGNKLNNLVDGLANKGRKELREGK